MGRGPTLLTLRSKKNGGSMTAETRIKV